MSIKVRPSFVPVVAALAGLAGSSQAQSQCGPHWLPGESLSGVHGFLNAMTAWDPDGPGPRGPVAVLAGSFDFAGSLSVGSLATWDPADGSWATLPDLPRPGNLWAAAVRGDELIVAGGYPYEIKRWRDGAWAAIGQTDNDILALAATGGELFAGGLFTRVSGVPSPNIARWDGAHWSTVGAGLDYTVNVIAVAPGGDVLAAGSVPRGQLHWDARISRWNGASWTPLSGDTPGQPKALAVLPDGRPVMIGHFEGIGGPSDPEGLPVGVWDGRAWVSLSPQLKGQGDAFAVLPDGSWLLAGTLTVDGRTCFVARWDGARWSALWGYGREGCHAIIPVPGGPAGHALIGGLLGGLSGVGAAGLARWNGSRLEALGRAPNYDVAAMVALPDGGVVAGTFWGADGRELHGYGVWRHGEWSDLSPGVSLPGNAFCMARTLRGEIVVGGTIQRIDNDPAGNVVLWDGTRWSNLRGGTNGIVTAAVGLPDGTFAIGGFFTRAGGALARNVARWTGSAWAPLGPGIGGQVDALVVMPNGDLIAGGYFTTAGGAPALNVARWNGSAWSPLGAGLNDGVMALAVLDTGDLVAAGAFQSSGGRPVRSVARWDGALWQPMGQGLDGIAQPAYFSLVPLPGGRLAAAGNFTTADGAPVGHAAVFDGAAWRPMDAGLNGVPRAMVALADGRIAVGGVFSTAGDEVSANFAVHTGFGPTTDYTGDGALDFADYAAFVGCFEGGACPPARSADFDESGFVDFFDYASFVAAFEAGC